MKKKILIILILMIINITNLNASTGLLKTNSVISCDGILYGTHGSDNHFHLAEETETGKYKAKGESLGTNWTCEGTLKYINEEKELEKTEASLIDCVDGDTAIFNIEGKETKFRFLAIDTPETVHPTKKEEPFGKEASNYTCTKLKNAKTITIEYEEEKIDKYGRNLGWIWTDGNLLQKELIAEGLGEVAYIYGNYKYTRILCETEQEAIENQKGIWSTGTKKGGYCSTLKNETKEDDKKEKQPEKKYTKETITGTIVIILAIFIKLLKK